MNKTKNFVLLITCLLFIVISGLSCISTIPVTSGASNLEKGEFDPYYYMGLCATQSEKDSVRDKSDASLINVGSGIRYGISKFINIDMLLWTGLKDIGFSPSLHFQLVDNYQRLKLCFRGLISYGDLACGKLEYGGMTELVWGPNESIYLGLRYEHRLQKNENDETIVMPIYCFFMGCEEGVKFFDNVTPFFSMQFGFSQRIVQYNLGMTFHFKRKKKE